MTKEILQAIKKIVVVIAGFEHRDVASSHALMNGIKTAITQKTLNSENIAVGVENLSEQDLRTKSIAPALYKAVERNGFRVVLDIINDKNKFPQAVDDESFSRRALLIDAIAGNYIAQFCKAHGIICQQLEDRNLVVEMDNSSPEVLDYKALAKFDKRRMDAMLTNTQQLIADTKSDAVFVTLAVGAGHVPVIAAQCLSSLVSSNQIVRVVPLLLVSDQLVEEMNSNTKEVVDMLEGGVKDFSVQRMMEHNDKNSQQIIKALTEMRVVRSTRLGIFADKTFADIVENAAKFISTPSATPSQSNKEKVVEEGQEKQK